MEDHRFRPLWIGLWDPFHMAVSWRINGGDPNHLLTKWDTMVKHFSLPPDPGCNRHNWRFRLGFPILKTFHLIPVVTSQHPGWFFLARSSEVPRPFFSCADVLLVGDPDGIPINLHLPLLLGVGDNLKIYYHNPLYQTKKTMGPLNWNTAQVEIIPGAFRQFHEFLAQGLWSTGHGTTPGTPGG